MDYKGIDYLRSLLKDKQTRVARCYKYYKQKDKMDNSQAITENKDMQKITKKVGWIPKAVDSLTNRLQFSSFGNDDELMVNDIFMRNNRDVLFNTMFKGAIISSCDFVYISKNTDGTARLQVIDGYNATGVIDTSTMLLTEGYAVLERDSYTGLPTLEAYFIKGKTQYYKDGQLTGEIPNVLDYPLLVPVVYNPDATRPFGQSLITDSLIKYVDDAKETLRLMSVSAQFYSFPQKWVTGLDNDTDTFDKWQMVMSAMMAFARDEDGNSPTVGQFVQQSMSPYNEQLKTIASLFGGETGLTLDDMGFPSSNPSSAEGIKASHETLRLMARSAQRTFEVGVINVAFLAKSLESNMQFKRSEFANLKVRWKPVFEIDATMLSGIGDGAIKINQAVEDYFDKNTLEDLTGIEASKDDTPIYNKLIDDVGTTTKDNEDNLADE
mgnify:FL=1|jgi:hypothetical protein